MGATLKFEIPRRLEARFKARAKLLFPKESYAFLLGTVVGDLVTVDDLWMPAPEEMARFATRSSVSSEGAAGWLVEAREAANEEDLIVCGNVHSHPYSWLDAQGMKIDRTQSETDLDSQEAWGPLVCGICTVVEQRSGRLRASFRWWGRTIALEVRRTNEMVS